MCKLVPRSCGTRSTHRMGMRAHTAARSSFPRCAFPGIRPTLRIPRNSSHAGSATAPSSVSANGAARGNRPFAECTPGRARPRPRVPRATARAAGASAPAARGGETRGLRLALRRRYLHTLFLPWTQVTNGSGCLIVHVLPAVGLSAGHGAPPGPAFRAARPQPVATVLQKTFVAVGVVAAPFPEHKKPLRLTPTIGK